MELSSAGAMPRPPFDDDGPLVYSGLATDMPAPEDEGIEPDEIRAYEALREACVSPGYKVITARMELHLFRIPCHRCGQRFMAWALYAPDGCRTGIIWDAQTGQFVGAAGSTEDVLDLPGYAMYVRALPPRVLNFLRHEIAGHPWTKLSATPGQPAYYANRCNRCGAVHGDHYLHLEGTLHQFWPSRADGVRKLVFEPSYLIMYYGLYRPLRPSPLAVENVLDNTGLPDDGAMMMGCAFCEWAAIFDADLQAKPLSRRCRSCIALSPFMTAACCSLQQFTLATEELPLEDFPHAE